MIGFTATIQGKDAIRRWAGNVGNEFHRRASQLLAAYAFRIEREAKREVPVGTGNLRSSITTELDVGRYDMRARVGTNVRYAPYVEFGTGLHGPKKRKYTILPVRASVLRWPVAAAYRLGREGRLGRPLYRKRGKSGRLVKALTPTRSLAGQWAFARRVEHPGMRSRPYLIPPFQRLAGQFQRDLQQLMRALRWPWVPSVEAGTHRRFRSRWL